jgi:hypothetical protein
MKAKCSSRKGEHSLNDKSETRVFLAMKSEYISSKRNLLGSNHLLQQTNKTKLKAKVKTLQEKRIVHEAIKK